MKTEKSGYLYVLTHPSKPDLYKVGQTTRHPDERLVEHNSRSEEYTGKVVKETGQKWELKTFIAVPDVIWAEQIFWGSTWQADIPFRRGIEIEEMTWKEVQVGLEAVKKAGVRPPPVPLPDYIYAYRAWMNARLEGRGINLLGHVRSKHGKSDFQCSNGHKWRTVPNLVAEGKGCPQCGIGERDPEEIRQLIKAGIVCLLVHPEKLGQIRIGRTKRSIEECMGVKYWGDWQAIRYRNVEDPLMAEFVFWEILGHLTPTAGESIEVELSLAEDAFRNLHYRLQEIIARVERAKDEAK